jgi:hypothetical protein
MSHARLFVPQEAVESWLSAGRADLQRAPSSLSARFDLTLDGRRFTATPAVRFLAEVAGGQDELDLVGSVQPNDHLDELAAEHSHEAVLLGDNAYQVAEGYLLTVDPELARLPDVMARLVQLFGDGRRASERP